MKQIILVALVLSVLLVFAVGTAFAAPDGDRDPGDKKSGLDDGGSYFEASSSTVASGGGVTGASSYEDSRLYSFSEAIR